MGQILSGGRRREDYYYPSGSHPPLPSSSSYPAALPPPPNAASYPDHRPAAAYGSNPPQYFDPSYLPGRQPYTAYHYGPRRGGGWWVQSAYPWPPPQQQPPAGPPPPPPPYVEHQKTKTVKNEVNLHKDTIRLVPDEGQPDQHLVSFTFDAVVDGSVTIYYFAKEGHNCGFSPAYPEMYTPKRVPFQKGLAQKFIQPSGSGIDLGFFALGDLDKPNGDIFPLVVYAEASPPSDVEVERPRNSNHAQITLAVIEKSSAEQFEVKVIKQILWYDGERYELQQIYGLTPSAEEEVPTDDDGDDGKECVICLTEPKDTTVLPCRHMCMCSECAKALRLQSNKCPICRQPVEQLLEIKLSNSEQ